MMLSALHPDVRFAPKSGHWLSVPGCPLWVKSTEEQRKTEVLHGGRGQDRCAGRARKRTRRNVTSRLRPGRETQSCSSSRRRPIAGHIFEPVEVEVLDRARDGDPVEDL